MFRIIALCALGSVFLPDVYARQAEILGFTTPVIEPKQTTSIIKKIDNSHLQTAYFAAGSYSYAESVFEHISGVATVIPGIMRSEANALHTVKVQYDPKLISYKALLHHYWRSIDPTDEEGQFSDRGSQFRSAVFYSNTIQRMKAAASFNDVTKVYGNRTATLLLKEGIFVSADKEYQDYASKHPATFSAYMNKSGRMDYLPVLRAKLDG